MSFPERIGLIVYFAYGSNMSTRRLRYRVPSCVVRGVAVLAQHRLCFHKRSIDGSGKCNALFTGRDSDSVLGVVFEIPANEKDRLDKLEGVGNGYHESCIEAVLPNGTRIEARTNLADPTHIDDKLKPYTWYQDFVLEGAREHQLPSAYITSFIEPVVAAVDPDQRRESKRRKEVDPT